LIKEIEDLGKRVEETKSDFNAISETCKAELQRFESTKAKDIKKMLVKLSQANLNFGVQYVDQWKVFLANELSMDPETVEKDK